MIEVSIESADGIVVVKPKGPLQQRDFENLNQIVDTYLGENDKLHGVLIHADAFPGWDSFAALIEHIRFIHDHHRRIEKVAVVTDSPVGRFAEILSGHFVEAEVKRFPSNELSEARQWLR